MLRTFYALVAIGSSLLLLMGLELLLHFQTNEMILLLQASITCSRAKVTALMLAGF